MLQAVLPANEFYRKKFSALGPCEINSMETLKKLPFTTKNELVEDQMRHPPFGTDLTFSRNATFAFIRLRVRPESRCTGSIPKNPGTGGRNVGR